MIQRIQSLYLFIVAALVGLMLVLPLGSFFGDNEAMVLTGFGFTDGSGVSALNAYGLTSTIIAASLLPFVTIFLYKRRMLQYRLCVVEMILLAGLLLFEAYYIWSAAAMLAKFELSAWNVGVGALAPVLSVVFMMLALRGIKKDIALIKSLDRIR